MDPSERIETLRRGDELAFKELFESFYPDLCQTAERYLFDRSQAEAVVADAFFGLWKVCGNLREDTDIEAYLRQSVRNRCLNFLKSKYVRSEVPFALLYEDSDPSCHEPSPSSGQEPMEGLLTRELQEKIMDAVKNLPDKTREVFEKNRFDCMSYAEIARNLGISVNTVKYHMKNALSILRSELGGYLFTLALLFLGF